MTKNVDTRGAYKNMKTKDEKRDEESVLEEKTDFIQSNELEVKSVEMEKEDSQSEEELCPKMQEGDEKPLKQGDNENIGLVLRKKLQKSLYTAYVSLILTVSKEMNILTSLR